MAKKDKVAEIIGRRYLLERELGRGGMGVVYRAKDRLTGQIVALKRVTTPTDRLDFATHTGGGTDSSTSLRLGLAQEFRTLATLRHPHIISVLDYGFDDEQQPYFTMDYLEAANALDTVIAGNPLRGKIHLLIQVLQALAYLHRRGIVHRDMKPGNVMVTKGQVKVLDFGLSQVHGQEDGVDETAGTLAYIAPEVLQGERATSAADLYAIGVMIYEALTGKHPFNVTDLGQLVMDVLMTQPDIMPLEILAAQIATSEAIDENLLIQTIEQQDRDETADKTMVKGDTLKAATDTLPTMDAVDATQIDLSSHLKDLPAKQLTSTPKRSIEAVSIATIVDRLLAKTPEERYAEAYQVIEDLCEAIREAMPEESKAIRESFLQAARFIGRETELKQLNEALKSALQGVGSSWLISGESGVGKTRLMDELRTRALVEGALVLHGGGVAGSGLPYQGWRDPLRRLVLSTEIDTLDASILKDLIDDISELLGRDVPDAIPLEGVAYHQRLTGTIISLFQRQKQPILLLLEDLQWWGESLDVLNTLNNIIGDLPIVIVANYRHEEKPDLPEDLPGMSLIKLERLSSEDIAQLSVSMLGEGGSQPHVLEFLQRETEGNVYFLVEVVRVLAEEAGRLENVGRMTLPTDIFAGGVQTVIERRLKRVPPEAERLLQLAAVAGREVNLELLNLLKGEQDLNEWLTLCSNSAVLEILGGNWIFTHDRLRQAALKNLADEVRPQLHRQVAVAIEKLYPNKPEQAAILAHHWREAGDFSQEFEYTRLAGDYTLRISMFDEAIRHYERALELLMTSENVEKLYGIREPEILLRLGEAFSYIGDYARALDRLEISLRLYEAMSDRRGIARVYNLLADIAWRQGEFAQANESAEKSLDLFRKLEDKAGIAQVVSRMGSLQVDQGDFVGATAKFEEALRVAEELNSLPLRATIVNNLGTAAFAQGQLDEARKYFTETLEIARETGERRKIATALLNLGSVSGAQQDFASAGQYFEETLDICRAIGERRGMAMAIDNLGILAYDQQDFVAARQYFEDSLAISRAIGDRARAMTTLTNLGDLTRDLGINTQSTDFYHQALRLAHQVEALPAIMDILLGLAQVTNDVPRGLVWLDFVQRHPAAFELTRQKASAQLEKLQERASQVVLETAQKISREADVDQLVAQILSDYKISSNDDTHEADETQAG